MSNQTKTLTEYSKVPFVNNFPTKRRCSFIAEDGGRCFQPAHCRVEGAGPVKRAVAIAAFVLVALLLGYYHGGAERLARDSDALLRLQLANRLRWLVNS